MDLQSRRTEELADSVSQADLELASISSVFNNSADMEDLPRLFYAKTGPMAQQIALNLYIKALFRTGADFAYTLGWKFDFGPREKFYRANIDIFFTKAKLKNPVRVDFMEPRVECPGVFFIRHPTKPRIETYVTEYIWYVYLPALVLVETICHTYFNCWEEKLIRMARSLAVIRICGVRTIRMNYGSLEGWSDFELQSALLNAQLLIVCNRKQINPNIEYFKALNVFYQNICGKGYQEKFGIQTFDCIHLFNRKGNNPNIDEIEEIFFTDEDNQIEPSENGSVELPIDPLDNEQAGIMLSENHSISADNSITSRLEFGRPVNTLNIFTNHNTEMNPVRSEDSSDITRKRERQDENIETFRHEAISPLYKGIKHS